MKIRTANPRDENWLKDLEEISTTQVHLIGTFAGKPIKVTLEVPHDNRGKDELLLREAVWSICK